MHEGGDQMVTALVLLRRAWGVRRWDRTSGGKVGSSSQIFGVLASVPPGVAGGGDSASVSLGGFGRRSGAEQTDGDGGGGENDRDAASEVRHDVYPQVWTVCEPLNG